MIGTFARGVPILGLTGVNGAGKTLVAVSICIERMKEGREVYSTVPIRYVDPVSGEVYESKPILSTEQLQHLNDVTVFFDDIAVIFPSGNLNLPPEIEVLLHTLRHHGVDVLWTAPGWMRANNNVRLITQGLVNVQPTFRKSEPGNPWPTPRLLFLTLFDTSVGKVDATPEKILTRKLALPRKLDGFGAYDTLADTPLLFRKKRQTHCSDCMGAFAPLKHSEALHSHLGIPWYGD